MSATPQTPGTTFYGNGGDTGNPRMVTWLKLQDKLYPYQRYFIMDTHWSLDSYARQQSGELMRSKIIELSGGLPTIVMGDLNENNSSPGYTALKAYDSTTYPLKDAYDFSGSPDGQTVHNWLGGTGGARIDHILVSKDDFQSVYLSGTIVRTTFAYGYPSDHYPLTVEVTCTTPITFATWARNHGLDGTAGKAAGPLDDPDKDGRSNLVEFACNGNPLDGANQGGIYGATCDSTGNGRKDLILTIAVLADTPAFSKSASPAAAHPTAGITYTIEGSTSLTHFSDAPVAPTTAAVTTGLPVDPATGLTVVPGTGYEFRSFSLSGSNGLPANGFLRAKIEQTMP